MIKSSKCEKLKKKQFNIFILPGVCIVCIMDTVTKKKNTNQWTKCRETHLTCLRTQHPKFNVLHGTLGWHMSPPNRRTFRGGGFGLPCL